MSQVNPPSDLEQAVKDNNHTAEEIINRRAAAPQNITDLPKYKEIYDELMARGEFALMHKIIDLLRDVLELTHKRFLETMENSWQAKKL